LNGVIDFSRQTLFLRAEKKSSHSHGLPATRTVRD
jgi:hypothetical protein